MASAFLVFTPNLPEPAPVASIMALIPARIPAGKCCISSASLWMSGSHSAPLAIMYSTFDCALTDAGNPAPPAPTTPHSRSLPLNIN
jgi:hypothetical protein